MLGNMELLKKFAEAVEYAKQTTSSFNSHKIPWRIRLTSFKLFFIEFQL